MAELLEDIGHNVRRLREEKGWNQVELSFHADTSPSIVSLIENGKRNPSTTTLAKIARALGVEVVDLFPKGQSSPPNIAVGGRRTSWEVERWGDLLKHIGGILQDLEGKHDPHGENFAELSWLFFNTVSVYRITNPKAGATPRQVEYLEQAEGVLRLGLQMLEERAEKAHAGVTNLDEYKKKKREAVTALRGTA